MYGNAASVEHFTDSKAVHSQWHIDDDALAALVYETYLEVMLHVCKNVLRMYVGVADMHYQQLDAMLGRWALGEV